MKSEYKFFGVITLFLLLACVVYAWWTAYESATGQIEWIGVVALALSSVLCLMCGGYFWFVSRRIDLRPRGPRRG
jgi:cytosine/uracil/thiamine/allantoin permease